MIKALELSRSIMAIAMVAGFPILAHADQKKPVVVELFTSQGCSSCPPANANLIELSKRPDILALSYAVTYWDYLGWKDSFGRAEFTQRQIVYEPALGEQGPFTPQMVIDGRASTVGVRLNEVERLIAEADSRQGPPIELTAKTVAIGTGKANGAAADVWLVRYDPKTVVVPFKRGENGGRALPHTNVVHSLDRIGQWSGEAVSLDLPPAFGGLRTAVLVQSPRGGPILSAVTD